jgi:hypothetical protein
VFEQNNNVQHRCYREYIDFWENLKEQDGKGYRLKNKYFPTATLHENNSSLEAIKSGICDRGYAPR